MSYVSHVPGPSELDLDRRLVVILAAFAGVDDLGHESAYDWRVLELVATRTYRHVVARQLRPVVHRDPVCRHVVDAGDSARFIGTVSLGSRRAALKTWAS